jgi:hypothetical protein
MKPEHLGIEYDHPRWQPLWRPGIVTFAPRDGYESIVINNVEVGTLEPRPHYCDRGRFIFRSDLTDIDVADGFPRYYMDLKRAKEEITAWLRWRLWRKRWISSSS